jgi:hypothetical protein
MLKNNLLGLFDNTYNFVLRDAGGKLELPILNWKFLEELKEFRFKF